jgi:hypothetical protein
MSMKKQGTKTIEADGLSPSSTALLAKLLPGETSVGRRIFVTETLRCFDRLNEVRTELTAKPMSANTRCLLIELETKLRDQFASMWRRAKFDYDVMVDSSMAEILNGKKGIKR